MAEGASTWHRRTLRSISTSYARALDRAHNLSRLRDEIGLLPITSRAGNDRNASPGELDFMHGLTTNRHEGGVSAMLTENGLSIPLRLRYFKDLVRRNEECKPTSAAFRVLSVLTTHTCGPIANAACFALCSRATARPPSAPSSFRKLAAPVLSVATKPGQLPMPTAPSKCSRE